MSARRWLVLAALAAALVAVQARGLDPQPEKRTEDRYSRLSDVPVGDVLPTYIASLFFGAFRAVVVDVLWIQLKQIEDEKRWYEAKEILKLISHFQPRNPEVWTHLGWHAAYNIANGFTDPERRWEWFKYGLRWVRNGARKLPDSAQLKYELGFTLLHKPSWRYGDLDLPLLRRLEEDEELQEDLLPAGVERGGRTRSAFELCILWLERARDDLKALPMKGQLTPMGLYLWPSTMDGFIRQAMVKQGFYAWQARRTEESKDWFRRSADHSDAMVRTYPDLSPLFTDWVAFNRRMPEVLDLAARARSERAEDDRAFLALVQKLYEDHGPLDDGFLWNPRNPDAPLDRIKRRAAGGKDLQEYNDLAQTASELGPGNLPRPSRRSSASTRESPLPRSASRSGSSTPPAGRWPRPSSEAGRTCPCRCRATEAAGCGWGRTASPTPGPPPPRIPSRSSCLPDGGASRLNSLACLESPLLESHGRLSRGKSGHGGERVP
jgi:hypothetical protein